MADLDPIGYLDGNATAFWLIGGDAHVLTRWQGQDGSSTGDGASDYDRALDVINEGDDARLAIGDASGMVIDVGEASASRVWVVDGGIALWTYRRAIGVDMTSPDVLRQLGDRIRTLPARGEPILIGSLAITSGCLGLVVPFLAGFTADEVAATIASDTAQNISDGHLLVPVPNGNYDVLVDALGEHHSAWYEDTLGRYQTRVRIVRRA